MARGVTRKGEVSIGIGISSLSIKVSSPETGFVSSISEEDIETKTPEGVMGNLLQKAPRWGSNEYRKNHLSKHES